MNTHKPLGFSCAFPLFAFLLSMLLAPPSACGADDATRLLDRLGLRGGILACVDVDDPELPVRLAQSADVLVYAQAEDEGQVRRMREAALRAGLWGTRVFVEAGPITQIHLAGNLADGIVVGRPNSDDSPPDDAARRELLRVVHPGATAIWGDQVLVKPRPEGADDWTHPYHGPDNNPRSLDLNVKAPYLTQFLCPPWYVPMPQVTVASGGRVFKAFGHIALKQREWPWLNALVAINGYNGTQLWRRELDPGFMIHRNTMIATPRRLFLADQTSCKVLAAESGELLDEIVISSDIDPDGVWKWMALDDGILYALVGPPEPEDPVIRGDRRQPGWPWSGLGDAYGGQYAWGFGRTLVAIDVDSRQTVWSRRWSRPIDSRAMCMASKRIVVYSHQDFLSCIDATTGESLWTRSDPELMKAIGAHDRAQTAPKGFASTAYAKINDKGIYFAGPQRRSLVAVSVKDGALMWSHPHGNFQLILRDDALYAMGRMETSKKFDYSSGEVLADLECYRGNCTRATATFDSIFTRGYRHTGTMRLDLSGNRPLRIPLMRPACQDGVIISDGMLYWGPWMCDCNHSLVGMIGLSSVGDRELPGPDGEGNADSDRLIRFSDLVRDASPARETDWPAYRAGVERRSAVDLALPESMDEAWRFRPDSSVEPTAAVTAHGTAFWSGMDGIVRAVDCGTGRVKWTTTTGGAVRFPPEYWEGRVYVGSSDGCVHCFDAVTGDRLWRFRAAPAMRKIAVHGRLMSTWPVGSGVLVVDGIVYAAAGITSYDGTYVFALDARTGTVRWRNDTSGRLAGEGDATAGVSVQGHLLLHEGRLYLAGGNVVSPAVYDARDGRCLNRLSDPWWDRPEGAKDSFPPNAESSMFHRAPRGRELFLVDGKVRVFDQLLYSPPEYDPSRYFGGHFLQASDDDVTIRATSGRVVSIARSAVPDQPLIGLWQHERFADPRALALCRDVVLVAGMLAGKNEDQRYPALSALDSTSGETRWSRKLPSMPVSWGLAVDGDGRVVVCLVDGQVVGFSGS